MKIVCYYNRNLKMSEGKLAAQIGHVCKQIGITEGLSYCEFEENDNEDVIVVLGLRETKFKEKLQECEGKYLTYTQTDLGYTEVEKGTITCFGYVEDIKFEL